MKAAVLRALKQLAERFEAFMNPRGLITPGQEAYLAEAKDHCDLEARMRNLERRQCQTVSFGH